MIFYKGPLRMDKATKREWIDALRSGEYEQGPYRLHAADLITGKHTYCCFGVLCEVVGLVGKEIKIQNASTAEYAYDEEREFLPSSAARLANMNQVFMPFVIVPTAEAQAIIGKYDGMALTLAQENVDHTVTLYFTRLNDAGISFEDIATIIEKYVAEVE